MKTDITNNLEDTKMAVIITHAIKAGEKRKILTKEWKTIEELIQILKSPFLSPGVERFVMACSRIDEDGNRYVVNFYSDCCDIGLKLMGKDLYEQTPMEVSDTYHTPPGNCTMTRTTKSCVTCRHWTGDENDGLRQCSWPQPELPFWANISDGSDHDDWTGISDGKKCRTWEEKL